MNGCCIKNSAMDPMHKHKSSLFLQTMNSGYEILGLNVLKPLSIQVPNNSIVCSSAESSHISRFKQWNML